MGKSDSVFVGVQYAADQAQLRADGREKSIGEIHYEIQKHSSQGQCGYSQ
jgi:hypothetical protein